ncbi:MAG: spore gernimation protein [Bacillus thermozeamaize]|uniref:Spore gernimation protein n=1 Tax=Bacillus thermozeamaize TaxID=230954 RepID=A0A1Y3PSI3_9BACI|nr:MAG: spore gernimation protein [Bacillus thermozeamaize]
MVRKVRHPVKVSELKKKKKEEQAKQAEKKTEALKERKLSRKLADNIDTIRHIFGESDDLVMRNIILAGKPEKKAAIVFIDGLVNATIIDDYILKSLMFHTRQPTDEKPDESAPPPLIDQLIRSGLTINEVGQANDFRQITRSLLSGDTVLLVDGEEMALFMNTKGWERRAVQEPNTESVVRGPRDGFTETMRVNTALIRLRLKDPDLRVKNMTIGKRTNTDVAVIYIDGIVDQKVLEEVVKRLQSIDIDGALESGYLEQLIEDNHWSPFPQIQNTERPDKAVANLLEGKVIIVTDGTPFVLIAPAVFSQFYHSPEDYYERFGIGTFIRFIRLISMGMSLLLPSLYIAFTSFHPEMIPSKLAIAMMAGRATVPFPAVVEAMLMEIAVEILREASVRLPGPIGPTIGIVGALIIGESAVSAGIISPILVIIVGLTTLGSFATPSYSAAIALRMLRFPMMLAAGTLGLLGIMLFLIVIIIHLSSLKSFGVPYMAPISPSRTSDLKDALVRAPLFWMRSRPKIMKPRDDKRLG